LPTTFDPVDLIEVGFLSEPAGGVVVALPQNQVIDYFQSGFLICQGLVSAKERAQLIAEVDSITRGFYPIANRRPCEPLSPISTVYAPHGVSSLFRAFIHHPGIVGVVSQLAAAHRVGWDGSTKFVQSTLFIKPPGCPGHPWHQDARSIETCDQSVIAAWIALDPAIIENGCIWVLPGTHRTGYLWPVRPHNDPDYDFPNESFGFDPSDAMPLEVEPGAVIFFSGTLLHSSRINHSNIARRSLANHYCSAWSELPWTNPDGFRYNDRRDVVIVSGTDPYAWKGYTPPPAHIHVRYLADVRPLAPRMVGMESGAPEANTNCAASEPHSCARPSNDPSADTLE
jgi:phytanoyl-CoA hydroxylase